MTDHWIQDDCLNGWIWPNSRERCVGILKIHRSCEPPCPRKQSAAKYLEEQAGTAL